MSFLSTPRRVVLTGASRGIGRAAAALLGRSGHRLVLVARDRAALEVVAAEVRAAGGEAEVASVDLTDPVALCAVLSEVAARGPVDAVINNAGVCRQGLFLAQDERAQRVEMDLNYWAALGVARALLPAMIAGGGGVVVNVSSLLGRAPTPTTAHYGATKAALEAWSDALRAEVAPFGVRLLVFVAPHTDTEAGRRIRFDGVASVPVATTAAALVRALDQVPRRATGSPVYTLLELMGRWVPRLLASRMEASVRPMLPPPR